MSFLKTAIDALDPAPDKKTELTLALNLLFELAEQKNSSFKQLINDNLRTAGTGDNRSIPITEILAWNTQTHAYVKADAGELVTKVTDAIRDFVSGGTDALITGIGKLVTTGLEAIIGAGSGAQAQMSSYYIVVQSYGIARYDIYAWSRQIEAHGITSRIESALAFTAAQSSVDVSKLTFNTFLIAYGDQLKKIGLPDGEIKEYLDYAQEVFNWLKGDGTAKALQTSEAVSYSYGPAQFGSTAMATNFLAPGELVLY